MCIRDRTHIVGEAVVAGKQEREERQLAKAREAAGDAPAAEGADAPASEAPAEKAAQPETPAAETADKAEAAPADKAAAEAVENVDSANNDVDPV